MELIDSPQAVLTAARTYSSEALEVIASIMRKSDSEKMRLLAAMALLDRCKQGEAPPRSHESNVPETLGDMRSRIVKFAANAADSFDENEVKTALALRSPASAIRATLVQLSREGALVLDGVRKFRGK